MKPDTLTQFDSYIVDVLLPDLVGHDRRPSAFIVYLYLWCRNRGNTRRAQRISLQTMAAETGLSKRTVQLALEHLLRRRLITRESDGRTDVPAHRVLSPWRWGAGS